MLMPMRRRTFIFACLAPLVCMHGVDVHAQEASPDHDVPSLISQAQRQLAFSHTDQAQSLLNQALTLSPNNPTANLLLGNLLLADHHDPEAMDCFETILAVDLHNQGARQGEFTAATRLALAARNAGRPEAALAALDHASKSLPDDPTLLLDLGIQADQLRQYPIARHALESALKLRPEDPAIFYALARLETDERDLPAAEQHLRRYLALKPNDASAHFGLGHVLVMAQRIPEAKEEFQRSIALQPVQTESYYQLGQIATDLHQDAEAKTLLERVLARDANHGGSLTALGVLAFRSKHYPEARQYLDRAVKASPDYQPAHYYLGLTLARLGEASASERELNIAVDLAHEAQQNRQ